MNLKHSFYLGKPCRFYLQLHRLSLFHYYCAIQKHGHGLGIVITMFKLYRTLLNGLK